MGGNGSLLIRQDMDYLLLVVGLGLLLLAANYLVDSSVAIAQRAKISNFIIGLTIVGIGTSAPELFASKRVTEAFKGSLSTLGNRAQSAKA